MALDGKTGKTIWKTWTDHKVFAITCQADLNGDSVVDCVVGGMSGVRRLIFTWQLPSILEKNEN